MPALYLLNKRSGIKKPRLTVATFTSFTKPQQTTGNISVLRIVVIKTIEAERPFSLMSERAVRPATPAGQRWPRSL